MKIVVVGGTGMVGSRVVAEAARRGHQVTAVSRSGAPVDGATSVRADLSDIPAIQQLATDADAMVLAVPTDRTGGSPDPVIDAHRKLIASAPQTRLVVVGGAGSLNAGEGQLKDTPDFPAIYKNEADAFATILQEYRSATDGLDWTVVCPSPVIAPGDRKGYVTALDEPVGDFVSAEDFADAIVDELQQPRFRRTRFTAASKA